MRAGPLESREGFVIGSGKVEQREADAQLRTSDVELWLPRAHGREAGICGSYWLKHDLAERAIG